MATREVISVQLNDGRKVDFGLKQKMKGDLLIPGIDGYNGPVAVRFDYISGETRTFPVPEQHRDYSSAHGYKQKLADWVAGLKDNDGNPADADDVLLNMEELHTRLSGSPDWNATPTGGGGTGGTIVLKAFMELTGKTLVDAKAVIEAKLKATEGLTRQALYASLRKTEQLKPIIAKLEAERDSKRKNVPDGVSLLAELTSA